MKKLFFLLLLISINAMADVVFIDLNNVEMEIEAARKAAKLRGENLIVLPLNRNSYKNPERSKLEAQIESTYLKIDNNCEENSGSRSQSRMCEKLYGDLEKMEDKYDKLPAPKQYDAEKLQEELATLKGKISSVMISGHDGNGDFYGEFGHINGEDFLEALTKFPGRNDIKSLYLLGCRSATSHTLADLWRKALPKAHFIAGYEGTGYLRDNGLSHSFIKNVMAQEQKIINSATMIDALKTFRSVFSNDKTHNTAASLVLNCDSANPIYLSSINPAKPLQELFECDKDFTNKLNSFLECATSESSPCEIAKRPMELIKNLEKPAVCSGSLTENLSQLDKIKNKLYFLNALGDAYSYFNPKQFFTKLPTDIQKKLGINLDELKTYPEIKQKLLAVKNFYENKFDYAAIKDMPIAELNSMASNKIFFDRMWIAVSNMDFSTLRQIPTASPGSIRAQAFFKAKSAGEDVGNYKDRIEQLTKERANLPVRNTYDTILYYTEEIDALKQYERENP